MLTDVRGLHQNGACSMASPGITLPQGPSPRVRTSTTRRHKGLQGSLGCGDAACRTCNAVRCDWSEQEAIADHNVTVYLQLWS